MRNYVNFMIWIFFSYFIYITFRITESANITISKCYATGNAKILNKVNNPDYYDDAYTGGFIGAYYLSIYTQIENCFVFNEQTIDGGIKQAMDYITSTTMEAIWTYFAENWDSDIWNLTTTSNPTLK